MQFQILLCFVAVFLNNDLLAIHVKVSLQPVPDVARKGGHVALRCLYNLQGAPLYMVKWYRGNREFYRYTPGDTPKKKVFPTPGIHVDISVSNSTQVMLRNLEMSMSGKYSCEVSAEGPSFSTALESNQLEVYAPPESGPTIYTERAQYAPGDVLKANCTSPPSHPAVNLTLVINTQHMAGATKIVHNLEGGYQKSELIISEPLTTLHFRGGKMVIMCFAQLRPVYLEQAIISFPMSSGPIPERITSSAGISTITKHLFLLLFLVLLIQSICCLDYEEIYNFSDLENFLSTDYIDDEIPKNLKSSLT